MRIDQLKHHFLVAMPGMGSQVFEKSVIYIYRHDNFHSQGLIINCPVSDSLNDLLKQVYKDNAYLNMPQVPLHLGGPVDHNQAYLLERASEGGFPAISTMPFQKCRHQIETLAEAYQQQQSFVTLGCSQWHAGQLVREIRNNFWLVVPYNDAMIFETPIDLRWNMASQDLGVNMTQVAGTFGTA